MKELHWIVTNMAPSESDRDMILKYAANERKGKIDYDFL